MSNRKAEARRQPRRRPSFAPSPDRCSLLEPVTRASRPEALAFAARRPFDHVFLQWLLEGGLGSGVPAGLLVSRDDDGRVRGLAYFGGQLVMAAEDSAALDDIARETRRLGGVRMMVGPKPDADGVWERIRDWHPAPALIRSRQPLYLLQPHDLHASGEADVRLAREHEAELVAAQSARMILGELGYDPRAMRAGFVSGVRRAIAAGSWWVWIVDGVLRFQCNVGPRTAATAQVQGVWTPSDQRQRGYASLGLGAICRRLFATEATLTLYVNDFNAPAITLYEKLGFVPIGAFATYIFP